MSFTSQVIRLFFMKPHRVLIALFWFMQGKKQRALNRLRLLVTPEMHYQLWLSQKEKEALHPASTNNVADDSQSPIRFLVCCCDGQMLYVQNMDQKTHAILAGIGIGNIPKERIQGYLDKGVLLPLGIKQQDNAESFLAWKINNKVKD
ncbi:hypothetical protein [uncultured Paraglaciecola sp.]|jgi:hypothetical protein|uniref:hypothetical protein n=1 Tax=uncultured Paraglaciecola sp. TaxID=1765024 RepID=UPI0026290BE2|nr:hypothetical protein [uncultured Paraglaciecola sp.]